MHLAFQGSWKGLPIDAMHGTLPESMIFCSPEDNFMNSKSLFKAVTQRLRMKEEEQGLCSTLPAEPLAPGGAETDKAQRLLCLSFPGFALEVTRPTQQFLICCSWEAPWDTQK